MPSPAASTLRRSSGVSTVVMQGTGKDSRELVARMFCVASDPDLRAKESAPGSRIGRREWWHGLVTSPSPRAIFQAREQPGSRRVFASANALRKVRAPWARRQVTPGHGGFVVTDSATENRPPQKIVVRVKRWGKSPPRFPATEAAG